MRCLLRNLCKLADSDACNALCPSYIAMMGHSGGGGRVGAANVPADYRLLTLATSPAAESQAKVYELVRAYVATFPRQFEADGQRVKSLYLESESPGTGKTTTAAAVLNEWLIVHYIGSIQRSRDGRLVQPLDRPAYFLDVNEWQNDYNTFNRPRVPDSVAEPAAARYYEKQRIAQSVPFAVLDDIGIRDCTEGFRGDLHAIINARVAGGLPTVYTSNIPISGLARLYDARLTDRIRDMTAEIAFEGTSKRGMR